MWNEPKESSLATLHFFTSNFLGVIGYSLIFKVYYEFLTVLFPTTWIKKQGRTETNRKLPIKIPKFPHYHKYLMSATSSVISSYFFFKLYVWPLYPLVAELKSVSITKNILVIYNFYTSLQSNITPSPEELVFSKFYFGYLIVDCCWLYQDKCRDPLRWIHHGLVASCHTVIIFQRRHAWTGGFCMSIVEISSVLLNFRGFLKFHAWFEPMKLKFNFVFALTFFFFRICIYTLAGVFLIISPYTLKDGYFWWICAMSLNVTYFNDIVKHVKKEILASVNEDSLLEAFIVKSSPYPYLKLSILRKFQFWAYDIINRTLFVTSKYFNKIGIDNAYMF
jgi:hypothetical protein